MTNEQILVASIRSNVGHIRHALSEPDAGCWLRIEMACDKLIEAAKTYERRVENLTKVS